MNKPLCLLVLVVVVPLGAPGGGEWVCFCLLGLFFVFFFAIVGGGLKNKKKEKRKKKKKSFFLGCKWDVNI